MQKIAYSQIKKNGRLIVPKLVRKILHFDENSEDNIIIFFKDTEGNVIMKKGAVVEVKR